MHQTTEPQIKCETKTDRTKIGKFTIIVGDFNTLLSTAGRTTRQNQQGYNRTQHQQPVGSGQHL